MVGDLLPGVVLLQTGGTIDHIGRDRLDLAFYTDTTTRVAGGLLARIPEVARIAVVVERSLPLRGEALAFADWVALAAAVSDAVASPNVAGVVVTRGTNTLEETAYFLHLVLKTDRPVVLTAAMRPASALSGDGDLNLLNAIRVAAAPRAVGKGVLVVMNDAILSAREAVKTSTARLQAFQAPGYGPLGHADPDGTVQFVHAPLRAHTTATEFDLRRIPALPRVDVVLSHVGADGVHVDASVAAGARGIVSAGMGTGRGTTEEEAALGRARAAGVIICQASRAGSGRVMRGPWLVRRGFVAAGDLPPWQARVLLALALTVTDDVERIQGMFDRY